jgi:hypothetical protein
MSSIIYNQGTATVLVPASGSVAVYSRDGATVRQLTVTPNQPPSYGILGFALPGVSATFGPFTNATTVEINGNAGESYYSVGTAPAISDIQAAQFQPTPVALNATGALTAAAILGGIVTSTTGAAVAGTLPTGTVLDAASTLAVGDSFDWSVIATGANAFTVTAAGSHTIVGTAVVATVTSGLFRTVKTAAATFVTYRMS